MDYTVREILKTFLFITLIWGVLYLFGCFVEANTNLELWATDTRYILAMIGMFWFWFVIASRHKKDLF